MNRKIVLVTGGSRGIGRSTVIWFAKNNYDVVINYVNSYDSALSLKQEVESKYNVEALCVKADISNEEEVSNMVKEVIDKFGHIDCLVNNAGIAIDTTFEDKHVDNFRKTIDTNLIGTFLVSKYVGKEMLKNKSGSIINVSSTNGIDTVYPESLDYDASKAGVISLTHNFSKYLPDFNVNCVCPDWIDTDIINLMDEEYKKKIKFIKKEDLAKLIYKVCTNKDLKDQIIKVSGEDAR